MPNRKALILGFNDFAEHNVALVYKSVYLGETAALVDSRAGWESQIVDASMQGFSLTEIINFFLHEPNLILMHCDIAQSRIALRLGALAKSVAPQTKVLVFGRATIFIPQFFMRYPIDAIHGSGDREAAILEYMESLESPIRRMQLPGLYVADNGYQQCTRGNRLASSSWPFPALEKLPINDYMHFYNRHKGGKPVEIGVTAAKGCKYACRFCAASHEEGAEDRRREPGVLVDWLEAHRLGGGSIFQLWSPNILYDSAWVASFAQEYSRKAATFRWRGVTRTDTIDERNLPLAAASGCVELAIGVENIDSRKRKPLKSTISQLENAAGICAHNGVRLKGLLMLGYPGQTIEDVKFARELLSKLGMTFRFTGYTPLERLQPLPQSELDHQILESYDRRTFMDGTAPAIPPKEYFEILVTNGECLDE